MIPQEIIRTQEEIDAVLEKCYGPTHYTGMTYEDGIRYMYDWLTDSEADNPFDD